jgi:hypothetical protein
VLQAAVGGRMRLFISGGAPLPTYAGTFMATAMNVPVLQVRDKNSLTSRFLPSAVVDKQKLELGANSAD